MNSRTLPHAIDAEQIVLGSMMLDPAALATVREILPDPAAYFVPAHQVLAATLYDLQDRQGPGDAAGVQTELHRLGRLGEIGRDGHTAADGAAYLGEIIDGTPGPGNAAYYAGIVRDCHTRQSLIREAARLDAAAANVQTPLADTLEEHGEVMHAIVTHGQRQAGQVVSVADAIGEAVDHGEAVARGEIEPGLATGFPELDRPAPWQPGDLITLAGATTVGKTSLALAIAAHQAESGRGVLVVSAEMAPKELGRRVVANKSGVAVTTIKAGIMARSQAEAVAKARAEAKTWNFSFLCRAATVAEIAAKVRTVETEWREAPALIVVDYLQLMRPTNGKESKAAQVGGIAWGLKALAMETGSVVLMLSQFNRETVREGRLPTLYGLKESGDIENHSNNVILLHDASESDTDGARLIWAKVAKARDGMRTPWPKAGETIPGSIRLRFKPQLARFESREFPQACPPPPTPPPPPIAAGTREALVA